VNEAIRFEHCAKLWAVLPSPLQHYPIKPYICTQLSVYCSTSAAILFCKAHSYELAHKFTLPLRSHLVLSFTGICHFTTAFSYFTARYNVNVNYRIVTNSISHFQITITCHFSTHLCLLSYNHQFSLHS
jgi:hypothetical protein